MQSFSVHHLRPRNIVFRARLFELNWRKFIRIWLKYLLAASYFSRASSDLFAVINIIVDTGVMCYLVNSCLIYAAQMMLFSFSKKRGAPKGTLVH